MNNDIEPEPLTDDDIAAVTDDEGNIFDASAYFAVESEAKGDVHPLYYGRTIQRTVRYLKQELEARKCGEDCKMCAGFERSKELVDAAFHNITEADTRE